MKTITFTQFRNNARSFIDAVEKGERFEIFRRGRPVAVIGPADSDSSRYWKHERPQPLEIPGASLSEAILAEREESYSK